MEGSSREGGSGRVRVILEIGGGRIKGSYIEIDEMDGGRMVKN